jgi:uncharacterized protein YqjF (DUF2071 family)
MTGRRRRTRPWHVLVTIENLLIVTWDVPAHTMTPLLPDGLRPWTHAGRAMLSAALFRNRGLRPAWSQVPRFDCAQLNIRIYLADRDGRAGAVFFHALCLGSPRLARVARPLTRVPFRVVPFDIDVDRSDPSLSWRASSRDGEVRVAAHDASSSTLPDPATLDLLTNVHTGYVGTPGSPLRTWSIWHRHQEVRLMTVDELRLAPLAELGLGLGDPIWAFYVESVDYEVYLPARRAGP